MSGYRKRAPFYRSEFAARDDFPLLAQLLTGEDGLVIDIPSGAGRLLPCTRRTAATSSWSASSPR